MIFRNRLQHPKPWIGYAIGNLILSLAIAWPVFLHPVTKAGQDLSDGVHGLLLGLSIGINLVSCLNLRRHSGGT